MKSARAVTCKSRHDHRHIYYTNCHLSKRPASLIDGFSFLYIKSYFSSIDYIVFINRFLLGSYNYDKENMAYCAVQDKKCTVQRHVESNGDTREVSSDHHLQAYKTKVRKKIELTNRILKNECVTEKRKLNVEKITSEISV